MIGGAWLMKRKEKDGKRIGCVYPEQAEVKRDAMQSDTFWVSS
jgi:hypothetical protein